MRSVGQKAGSIPAAPAASFGKRGGSPAGRLVGPNRRRPVLQSVENEVAVRRPPTGPEDGFDVEERRDLRVGGSRTALSSGTFYLRTTTHTPRWLNHGRPLCKALE